MHRRLVVTAVVLFSTLVGVSSTASAEPTPEVVTWRMVSAGSSHTCGILSNDRLYCWGDNTDGQIGRNTGNPFYDTPVEVGGGHWTTVSAGGDSTCAIRPTRRLYCWGDDDAGQLGDGGADTDQLAPTQVAGGHTDWTAVQIAGDHACGRRTNGRLYCWGGDGFGELGDNATFAERDVPTLVAGGATNWTSVTVGEDHSCGRRANGRIYCWGGDSYGTLGDGAGDTTSGTPRLVAGGITDWTVLDGGGFTTCARRSNGRLYCWGTDYSGVLGNGGGNDVDRFAPSPVAGGNLSWSAASIGYYHACGLRSTRRLFCWGEDGSGQLGNGPDNTDQRAPVAVDGGATNWTLVAAGNGHTCARKANGTLWCWGYNADHQLGVGGSSPEEAPAKVNVPPGN